MEFAIASLNPKYIHTISVTYPQYGNCNQYKNWISILFSTKSHTISMVRILKKILSASQVIYVSPLVNIHVDTSQCMHGHAGLFIQRNVLIAILLSVILCGLIYQVTLIKEMSFTTENIGSFLQLCINLYFDASE